LQLTQTMNTTYGEKQHRLNDPHLILLFIPWHAQKDNKQTHDYIIMQKKYQQ